MQLSVCFSVSLIGSRITISFQESYKNVGKRKNDDWSIMRFMLFLIIFMDYFSSVCKLAYHGCLKACLHESLLAGFLFMRLATKSFASADTPSQKGDSNLY